MRDQKVTQLDSAYHYVMKKKREVIFLFCDDYVNINVNLDFFTYVCESRSNVFISFPVSVSKATTTDSNDIPLQSVTFFAPILTLLVDSTVRVLDWQVSCTCTCTRIMIIVYQNSDVTGKR